MEEMRIWEQSRFWKGKGENLFFPVNPWNITNYIKTKVLQGK